MHKLIILTSCVLKKIDLFQKFSFSKNRLSRCILYTLYRAQEREHDIREKRDFDVPHA